MMEQFNLTPGQYSRIDEAFVDERGHTFQIIQFNEKVFIPRVGCPNFAILVKEAGADSWARLSYSCYNTQAEVENHMLSIMLGE